MLRTKNEIKKKKKGTCIENQDRIWEGKENKIIYRDGCFVMDFFMKSSSFHDGEGIKNPKRFEHFHSTFK